MATLVLPNADYGSKVGDPAVGQEVQDDLTTIQNFLNGANLAPTSFEMPFESALSWDVDGSNSAISILSSNTVSDVKVTRSLNAMGAGEASLKTSSSAAETTGEAMILAEMTSASSTIPVAKLKANSTSPLLQGQQDGSGDLLYFKSAADDFFKLRKDTGEIVYESFNGDTHRFDINGQTAFTLSPATLTLEESGGNTVSFESSSADADTARVSDNLQLGTSGFLKPGAHGYAMAAPGLQIASSGEPETNGNILASLPGARCEMRGGVSNVRLGDLVTTPTHTTTPLTVDATAVSVSGVSGTFNLGFATPYLSPPVVVVTPQDVANQVAWVSNITATDCDINIQLATNTTVGVIIFGRTF
jgi:hypothetical protein